jgi:hypothetical protein
MVDILLKQVLKPNVKTIVKTRYSQDECRMGTLCELTVYYRADVPSFHTKCLALTALILIFLLQVIDLGLRIFPLLMFVVF